MKRGVIVALVIGLAVTLAACSSSAPKAATSTTKAAALSPYRVLMILGISGPLATTGQAEVTSFKASAAVLNAKGGVNGHQITIDVKDDQGNPTTGTTLLVDALSGTKPDLVFPGTSSSEALAMLPLLTKNKILSMSNGASPAIFNAPATNPYSFSSSGNTTGGGVPKYMADYLKSKGYSTVGLLYSNDANGLAQITPQEAALKAAGLTYSAQTFSPTALDMTPQLEALRAAHPDALIVSAFGSVAGVILNNRQKLGWTVPVVGDPSLAANDLVTLAGPAALNGVTLEAFHLQQYQDPSAMSPGLTAMLKAVLAQGKINTAIQLYGFSYDMLQIVSVAAKQANSIDGPAVASNIEKLPTLSPAPWVALDNYGYTSSFHGSTESASDFAFIPAGTLVNGMIKPVS